MISSKTAKAMFMLSVVAAILGFGQVSSLAAVKKIPFTLYKERQYKEPLSIVGFKTSGPDWAGTLQFTIKNVSKKPVYAFLYAVDFPEVLQDDLLQTYVTYGDPTLLKVNERAPKGTPFLAPGATTTLTIPAEQATALESLLQNRDAGEPTPGVLHLIIANFGDETSWNLGRVISGPEHTVIDQEPAPTVASINCGVTFEAEPYIDDQCSRCFLLHYTVVGPGNRELGHKNCTYTDATGTHTCRAETTKGCLGGLPKSGSTGETPGFERLRRLR